MSRKDLLNLTALSQVARLKQVSNLRGQGLGTTYFRKQISNSTRCVCIGFFDPSLPWFVFKRHTQLEGNK